jgi:hypothetical protein
MSLYAAGLSRPAFTLVTFGIALLIIADILNYRDVEIREKIIKQAIWYRWLIMIGAILAILVFGIWGAGYDASSFIYQQF